MDQGIWNILLVDDDEDYFVIVRELLSGARQRSCRLDWAASYEDGWKMMQGGTYDCVLMDYALGPHRVEAHSGLDLTRKATDSERQFPPIILLTGHDRYEVDLEAMQAGAAFYLIKDEMDSRVLERTIRYAIERQRAEEEVRHQHELLETVIQNTPVAISLMRGHNLRIEVANPAYQVFASREGMDGKALNEFWIGTDEHFFDLCRQVLSSGDPYHVKDDFRRVRRSPDGPLEPAYYSWSLYRVDLPSERGWGILNTAWETTELKQAEQAARKASEQLREYSERLEERVRDRTEELVNLQRRLVDNVEAERLWVSQELHDGPMQEIYGLIFKLASLKTEDGAMQADLASAVEKLQQVNDDLRGISRELRPTTLAPFGLEKAIREHSERFDLEHPELDLILDLQPDGSRLPEHVRLSLFRIYQVGVTNVIRHAQANTIFIRLTLDEESAILEIQDDGQGFDVPQRLRTLVRHGHYGLAGAAERAEAMGGRVEVESAPGNGTRLRVIVPAVIPVPSMS